MFTPLAEPDPLIGLIYQGPLETPPWQSFLHQLRLRLGCDVAAITLRPGRLGLPPLIIWDREQAISPADSERNAQEHARLLKLDPLAKALSVPGAIYTLDEVISREDLAKNEFYTELLKPNDVEYMLGMQFAEPTGWQCHMGLMNGPGRVNFGAREKQFLITFRPHLERALEIFARLKRHESEREIFGEALERLTIGTVILDGHGKIIDVNRVAQTLIRESGCVFVADDKLKLTRKADHAQLTLLINRALAWRDKPLDDPFVDALRIENDAGTSIGLLVRSVVPTDRYRSEVCPSAIVYISDSTQEQLAPERLVAQLFGLSASEASLAMLLANGCTLAEAGQKQGLTEATVRTYAKRIFAKTNVGRQADLVRLILKSVALLA